MVEKVEVTSRYETRSADLVQARARGGGGVRLRHPSRTLVPLRLDRRRARVRRGQCRLRRHDPLEFAARRGCTTRGTRWAATAGSPRGALRRPRHDRGNPRDVAHRPGDRRPRSGLGTSISIVFFIPAALPQHRRHAGRAARRGSEHRLRPLGLPGPRAVDASRPSIPG